MVITYKCPNCGAGLEFDSEKQMLVCVHCGTEKSVEEMEQMEQKESKSASQTNDFKMFHCPVCLSLIHIFGTSRRNYEWFQC